MREQNALIARSWTLKMIGNTNHLHLMMLKGLIASKHRYTAVKDIPEADFLHGVYQGLCDWFNDGLDIEDLSDDARAMLGLPLLEA